MQFQVKSTKPTFSLTTFLTLIEKTKVLKISNGSFCYIDVVYPSSNIKWSESVIAIDQKTPDEIPDYYYFVSVIESIK